MPTLHIQTHDMYNGPRDLIKKGRRFKARATVTKVEGTTTVLIHDVVEA
jgi:hypothetical protein